MKIYFFKESALDYFKTNVNSNIEKYAEPTNNWVFKEFKDPFIELKMDVPDFSLYIDVEHPNKMDLENAKRIYSNLKGISDSQATDERLWAGLSHSTFYPYVQKRWSGSREANNMKKASYILTRYFYGQHTPKFRNTLCKLWWIGRLTYDEGNVTNPFHLTDVLGNNDMATRVSDLFTSNFSRNIKVVKAFLEAVGEFDASGKVVNPHIFRSTVQYINVLGGVYLLDYFEFDELKSMIHDQIKKYFIEGPDVYMKKTYAPMLYLHDKAILLNTNTRKKRDVIVDMDNLPLFLERKVKDKVLLDGKEYQIVDIKKKKLR